MEYKEARAAIEAMVFASPRPVTAREMGEILGIDPRTADTIVDDLRREYDEEGRGMQIVFVAGGYQMATRPAHADYIARLNVGTRQALSRAALETVAMIAYKQPITRAELETIRGVRVDGVLSTLIERGLVRPVGRKKAPGRPVLYGTTPEFLRWFGLASLDDLPPIEGDAATLPGFRLRSAPRRSSRRGGVERPARG
ncbi:MAG: segregation and condensation protein [Bacillota bacterium]|nr:SMC-Scp complex subunit ScpB [Bacillota bacterium]MDI6637370.1 SMC-Scp complex subunit ScpB [Bacillota bacterium]MDK2930525.1 segregation and condensation protein [Bacillota bacterium]